MTPLKTMTIVGTRPEIIRLSRLIVKLDELTDHKLVHTGQNNDPKLNKIFFEDLDLRPPDHYLSVDVSSMGTVMGETIAKTEKLLVEEKPDAVLILGDTNSAIAAIVAERLHIPVYHMEAGNRSFDKNVPEELNRKMVDHVSTFNLPYNDYSLRNLLSEGIHPRFIQKTGSPIREIYEHNRTKIANSKILEELDLREREYFLVSIHRQENVDYPTRLKSVLDCLVEVRDKWGLPILVSTHPRTRHALESLNLASLKGIVFHDPFGYTDFNKLQAMAKCVISDSGTISEESAIMGFPAVTLRSSMERPEALDSGTILMSGLDGRDLVRAIDLATKTRRDSRLPEGYEVQDFSDRVVRFLVSTCRLSREWQGLI